MPRPIESLDRRPRSGSVNNHNSINLWKLLLIELNITPNKSSKSTRIKTDDNQALEQLLNIVRIPIHLEKFMTFGLLICLNSFLTLFTIFPIRLFLNCINALRTLRKQFTHPGAPLNVRTANSVLKRDIITIGLIIASLFLLFREIDISRIYHDIRGQAAIKLYVMFGVLEVADKLCSSLGQDILTVLFQIEFFTNESGMLNIKSLVQFAIFSVASVLYISLHGFIIIYQTISLNVAVNSYSNALLTLLLSNQFAEIKGAVFKKFEREGLFQHTCADLAERFQLFLMLFIISLRNLLQINNVGLIPNSWSSWNRWVGAIFGPSVIVIGSELCVDWLKHAYITRFNKIRPKIYKKFLYVLSLDFIDIFNKSNNDSLNRRIGLPLMASVVCCLRMTLPDLKQVFFPENMSFPLQYNMFNGISMVLMVLSFLCLLLIRLLLGLVLLKWANSIKVTHLTQQDKEERSRFGKHEKYTLVDDFVPGSPNTSSVELDEYLRTNLYDSDEPVPPNGEQMRNRRMNKNSDRELENIMRYDMASKRIW